MLITAPYNEKARRVLEESLGEVVYKPWKTNGRAYKEDELISLLQQTKANAFITEHDSVTEKVIQSFPDLNFIGVCRGTPSNVAVEAASEAGIPIFFTPARNAEAVAEIFIANVITFMRKTVAASNWLQDGKWESGAHDSYLQFKGAELAGKSIGMVGFGAIGQRIAQMVKVFPCTVGFYDPYIESPDEAYEKTSLTAIFENSDIVSVHLPANKQTEGMIDKALFSKMKPDAIFVNTSRAMVVNSEDLLTVLETKRIAGAILDVFDHEPPDTLDYRIIHQPNVLATPHIAGATFEVEDHHAEIMNRNLLNWFVNRKENESFVANRSDLAKKVQS
jgi:D-3-phosphoglycerate dehydrogenase